MNLLHRAKDILLAPNKTWPLIESEAGDARSLFTGYVMILALVPAIASLIGMSFVGIGLSGELVRVPLAKALLIALVSYALSLLMIYLLAQFASRLAPSFGGQANPLLALRLIAYSSTAGMLGGAFSVIPTYAALGLIPTLYSVFLLARGLPVMMKSAPERTLTYTCLLLIGTLVMSTINGAAAAALR